MTSSLILGLDVGGTKTAIVLGTLDGRILRREEFVTPAREAFTDAFRKIAAARDGFLARSAAAGDDAPSVVSVSVGGPLDIDAGILFSPPHLADWGEAPLKSRLSDHLALPVLLEHDGNAGALAEFYFGAGRGARTLTFLTLGTGLGVGIIIDGRIYHGATDAAGEVGHIRIADDGPEEYGKAGSWEGYCSASGMVKLAQWRFPDRWDPDTRAKDLVALALAGDPDAVGGWLGKGLAVLVDILNPDTIILGTLGVVLGELILEPMRCALRREALPMLADACRVVPAELGPALGDVAALMAAINAERQGAIHRLAAGDMTFSDPHPRGFLPEGGQA